MGNNSFQVVFNIEQQIVDGDTIKLSYSGGRVMATDGTMLEKFSNLVVKNNLPLNLRVPGKIEAEAFSLNQGLSLEACTDIGGGEDVGFTDPGDYLDYQIKVAKTAKYNMEIRVASLNTTGIIQAQQLNDQGMVLNFSTIYLPVTGGWQTWKSIVAEMSLTEGIGRLRIKILKKEFNLNWYKFSEKGVGTIELKPGELVVYPNPVNDELTIEIPNSIGQDKTLIFRNLNGVVVKTMEFTGSDGPRQVYVGDIPKGFYFLEVDISGIIHRTKLIVQ